MQRNTEYLENYLKGQEAIEEYRKEEVEKAKQERRRAEEAAKAEEEKRRAEEIARAEKEKRRAEEAARAEEERRREEEAARAEKEKRRAEEAARAEEEKRRAEEAANAEEEKRRREESAKAETEKRKEEVSKEKTQNNKKEEFEGFEDIFSEDIKKKMEALVHSVHGITAYEEKDYEKAFFHFSEAIELGLESAKTNLGNMYYDGMGVEKNREKAFMLYMEAAEAGDAHAQFRRGLMYEEAGGSSYVKDNESEAFKWYLKAAEQGNEAAQGRVGAMYYEGRGVEQNKNLALRWFWKVGEQGNTAAQQLTEMLVDETTIWGRLGEAAARVGEASYFERYLYISETKADLEDGFRWLQKAAVQDEEDAYLGLASIYESQFNNKVEAAKWYYKNRKYSLKDLERLQQEGIDIEEAAKSRKDENEVKTELEKAFQKGNEFYRKEKYEEAFNQYWKAAMTDHAKSQILLSFMCSEGLGTKKNLGRAEKWFERAGREDFVQPEEILKLITPER